MKRMQCLLLFLAMTVLGCSKEPPGPPLSIHVDTAKTCLQNVATTGELNSSVVSLLECASLMKATDPKKGEELEKGVKELTSLTSPEAIKKKAKEIAAKLSVDGKGG